MKLIRILVGCIAIFSGFGQAQTYLPDTSSNPLFGELLWHTLAYRQDIAVYPGEFAPRMPFAVSIPEGGRLIGSTVREYGSRTRDVTVVIDTKLNYQEVGRFYRAQFPTGWQEIMPKPSGLSFSTNVRNGDGYLPLCNPQTGTRVRLYGNPKDNSKWETSPNFVYINFFESAQTNPTCEDTGWRFPVILLPNNAMPFNGNGFGTQDFNYQSLAITLPNSSAKALFEHCSKQVPSNWKQLSISETEDGFIGVYSYADSNQSGLVLLSVNGYKQRSDTYVVRLTSFPQF